MATALETLPPGTTASLPPLPAGWQEMSYAALANGSLAILGTDVDLRAELSPGPDDANDRRNPYRVARHASGRIWTFDGENLAEGPAFPLASPYLLFDRFPDGRWLVARRRDDIDSGERILSPGGDALDSIYLGDGLAHLKIDDLGRIWVGWFDEGIFGNTGWRIPGRDRPPSQSGIACFDEHRRLLCEAEPMLPIISDCYALNVSGTTAWACTYVDFPIITLGNGPERRWPTPLSGTQAIAVAGDHLLAAGGYGADGNRLLLLALGENAVEICGE